MHSYYDTKIIFKTPYKRLSKLLIHALEKENENHVLDLWKQLYPLMMLGKLNFVSYEDYKNKLIKRKDVTTKSYKEIENEMDAVIAAYEKGGE